MMAWLACIGIRTGIEIDFVRELNGTKIDTPELNKSKDEN